MSRRTPRIVHALLVLLLAAGAASSLKAQLPAWDVGDVFAGVGHGSYVHCTNTGTDSSPSFACETIAVPGFGSDPTAGCVWDSQLNFYATDTKSGLVAELNGISHSLVQTITTGLSSTSVMFDSSGNLYVGNASVAGTTNAGVLKYVPSLPPDTSTGNFTYPTTATTTFNEGVNSDWIDLANDQKTLYSTGEESEVETEDLSAATPTPTDFSSLPAQAFALRLLPPFDGTGGLLLADTTQVVRLDKTGATVQTYTFPASTNLQALTLDPNGTSAWVGDFKNGNVFRFNISTGVIEATISTGSVLGGAKVNGVCVKGGPELNVVPLVYNVSTTPVTAIAKFGASAPTGFLNSPNFHTWQATVGSVSTKFVLVVTATEGIDLHRYDEYFCGQAVTGNSFNCTSGPPPGPTLTPIPYADQVHFDGTANRGKPVVYKVANPPVLCTALNTPPGCSYSGPIFIYSSYAYPLLFSAGGFYTQPTCPAPAGFNGPIAPVADPRMFRAPSSPPPMDAGNHQFAFDSSVFTDLADPGTGIKPPSLNEYNLADRCPTSVGSSVTFLSPLSNTTTTNANLGKSLSLVISVVDASGNRIIDGVMPPNNITLSITQFGVPLTVFGIEGSSPNFFKITSDDKYKANLDTGSVQGLQKGLAALCVTSINTNFVLDHGNPIVGTATGPGEFPPACTLVNFQ